MEVSFKEIRKPLILLLIVCQLVTINCSRRAFPGTSFPNVESNSEKRRLEAFFNSGVEKTLETGTATPDRIIATARKYIGVPHCLGGTTSKCIDCSGLLLTVFGQYGIKLPHSSEEQARYGKLIRLPGDLKKGDLVFFIRSYQTNNFITHSAICIGNNQFIHASTSKGVTITSLSDPWWSERFIFGTRIF